MFRGAFDPTDTFHAYQNSEGTGNPVRVVRGFKNRSEYGPEEGLVGPITDTER